MPVDGNGKVWKHLSGVMRGRWDARRHEDALGAGVPDVSYGCGGADGWIELKALDRWPARPDTLVRLDNLTPEQLRFLENRGRAGGGRCFVLLAVGGQYLLFRWDQARRLREGATRAELEVLSAGAWAGGIDAGELTALLTTPASRG
jgi:hypothetical protein